MTPSNDLQTGTARFADPTVSGAWPHIIALFLVSIFAALAFSINRSLPAIGIPLVLLFPVLISAARFGLWPGIVAAAAAFIAYNFLFVEPRFTLRVASPTDLIALGIFLFTAGLTGWLAGKARDEADRANRRAGQLAVLSQFTAELQNASSADDIYSKLANATQMLTGQPVAIASMKNDQIQLVATLPAGLTLDPDALQACDRALRYRVTQHPTAAGWTGNRFAFYMLAVPDGTSTCVGVRYPEIDRQRANEIEQSALTLVTLASEAGLKLGISAEVAEAQTRIHREQMRSGLLLSLSHDLRTPLATILGSVSSLRELGAKLSSAARDDLLLATEEETRRLTRYVDDLLTMTRLQSGMTPNCAVVSAAYIGGQALDRARQSHIASSFVLQTSGNDVVISTDAKLAEQALFNLLDNAAKFSKPSDEVTLEVQGNAEGVKFIVTDHGPGISTEFAERVFDPLFRGTDHGVSGTGLGLSIVKSIAELLGGRVKLESPVFEGKGSRFALILTDLKANKP